MNNPAYTATQLAFAYNSRYDKIKKQMQGIQIYRHLAKRNHPIALFQLAQCYEYGYGDLPYQPKRIFKLYQQAARLGYAAAQLELGWWYEAGITPIQPNPYKARQWYLLAAKQGNQWAWYRLGWLYENGYGGKKDASAAYDCYSQADAG